MSTNSHLPDELLTEPPSAEQARHLADCGSCSKRRETLLSVQGAVRGLPRTAEPPRQTLALLETEAGEKGGRGRVASLLIAVAAAVALTTAAGLAWSARPTPMEASLAQEIALDHLHYEKNPGAAEVSGSLEEIADFFAQTLQRRPRVAPIEAVSVVGGKRCRIGGEWSSLIWLERAGRWLSLFSLPHDVVASRGCVSASGVNVCAISEPQGGSRVLAGELPDAELLRLLDESTR